MKFEKALAEDNFQDMANKLSPDELASMRAKVSKTPVVSGEVIAIELKGYDDPNRARTGVSTFGDKLQISSATKSSVEIPGVAGKVIEFGDKIKQSAYIISNLIQKGDSTFTDKFTKALAVIEKNKKSYSPNTRPYDITYNTATKELRVFPDLQ